MSYSAEVLGYAANPVVIDPEDTPDLAPTEAGPRGLKDEQVLQESNDRVEPINNGILFH